MIGIFFAFCCCMLLHHLFIHMHAFASHNYHRINKDLFNAVVGTAFWTCLYLSPFYMHTFSCVRCALTNARVHQGWQDSKSRSNAG